MCYDNLILLQKYILKNHDLFCYLHEIGDYNRNLIYIAIRYEKPLHNLFCYLCKICELNRNLQYIVKLYKGHTT